MLSLLRRPRWLVATALVAFVVVGFTNLGLWQLRRHEERRTRNDIIAARLAEEVRPLDDVLAANPNPRYARVEAVGRYLREEEILLTGRSEGGAVGFSVLTPLDVGGGRTILVDRGWVPLELDEPPVAEAAPPAGEVRVTGVLLASHEGGLSRAAEDPLDVVARVDLDRLDEQVTGRLHDHYLLLRTQEPPPGQLPVPADPPELSTGPHLSYAVQWFVFALIPLVGYPLLLRRVARDAGGGDAPRGSPAVSRAPPRERRTP